MLPDLGSLSTAALTVIAAIVALRLLYLTALGFVHPAIYVEQVHAATGTGDEPGISELIQAELAALREEGGGPSLQLLTTPDAAIDVGAIEAGGGRLKELSALLRLLPGRTSVVSGRMQPAGALGQGISVTIRSSSNRVAGTVTLWEHDYVGARELPGDIAVDSKDSPRASTEVRQCLGLAAAAWVAYRVLEHASAMERSGLLTQDWESHALFRVGARLQGVGLGVIARRVYLKALERDPRNRGALFNLAVLDLYEMNEPAALERLRAVQEDLEQRSEKSLFDRLWYRVLYNIAVAHWNGAASAEPDERELEGERVTQVLRRLVINADQAIDSIGGPAALGSGGRYADLVRFLVDAREAAIIFYNDVRSTAVAP